MNRPAGLFARFAPCGPARRFAALTCVLLAASALLAAREHTHKSQAAGSSLVVHEWGTFTSVAGDDGNAVFWRPLSPKSDLPSFVEHNPNAIQKGGLHGTVRMETPVIYFHSSQQTTVSVHVSFIQGLITEWYPHATKVQPSSAAQIFALNAHERGSVAWDAVSVVPGLTPNLPREAAPSHYYAARETAASPLTVSTPSGEQHEDFLFYRGVASFPPPVSAKVLSATRLQLQSHTTAPLPAVVLFERRGDKLGYHLFSSLANSALVDLPTTTGTLDSLRTDFERLLVEQGLYEDEAHAMLETWRDSWFEEGSRLFYLVPRPFVDFVLPLSIQPTPGQLTRVFVGRVELVTPATREAVEAALLSQDHETLQKYGRFLEPIFEIISTSRRDPTDADRLRQALSAHYTWLLRQ